MKPIDIAALALATSFTLNPNAGWAQEPRPAALIHPASTTSLFDAAVAGTGYMIVADADRRYLALDGSFHLNMSGTLVNGTGKALQIFPLLNAYSPVLQPMFNTGVLSDLRVVNTISAPAATTAIDLSVNLDASTIAMYVGEGSLYADSAMPLPFPLPPFRTFSNFDPANPISYDYSVATTVYDSLSVPHAMIFYFRKVTDGQFYTITWQTFTTFDGNLIFPDIENAVLLTPASTPESSPLAATVLTFNTNGTLNNVSHANFPISDVTIASYRNISVTTGADIMDIVVNYAGTTQYGDFSRVNGIQQNGYVLGHLNRVDVDEHGILTANYTNGNRKILGQIAIARVTQPAGLRTLRNGLWMETPASVETIIGTPGSDVFGTINATSFDVTLP